MTARTIARYVTIALMGLAVLVATADGFAQSYAGLYGWALQHGLRGWKADSFPLLVDLFVAIGEMGMFLLAIDGHKLRKSLLSWVDLLMPGGVAAAGWGASLVFNVGHVAHKFSFQATAAVPPIASMVGLLILLRTLHRYVTQDQVHPVPEAVTVAVTREDLELSDALDGTPPALLAWLKGEAEPDVPAPDPEQVRAASEFADEVHRGDVPSIRAIKKRLQIGQDKARQVRAYLARLAENLPVPAGD